jgi:hypothetical protein
VAISLLGKRDCFASARDGRYPFGKNNRIMFLFGSVSKNADLRFMPYIENNLWGISLGNIMKFDVKRKLLFDNLFF